jgi:translation initiation factor 2 gamma subunit (eIF-2gamma)
MTRMRALVVIATALAACGGGGVGDAQKRLRTAVDAKQDMLDDCYEKTLARDAEAKGDVQVLFKVSNGGDVKSEVKGGKLDGKLLKCVQKALDEIKLSPGPGANMEVTYDVTFEPEG